MTFRFAIPPAVFAPAQSEWTGRRGRWSRRGGYCLTFCAILTLAAPKVSQGQGQPVDNTPVARAIPVTSAIAASMNALEGVRPLRSGDRLSYRVIEDGDPIAPLTVTDSGEMEVPYYGRVQAAGKTCKSLAFEIKGKLERSYYIQATVLMGLDQAAPVKSAGRVYLVGQVNQQGAQDIPPDETYTVSKAILKAGGFADFADKRKVKLVRRGNKGGSEAQIVDLVEILQKGRTANDPIVGPDDLIIVPQRLVNF